MKKEQVLELMNAVPHDLIEEADLQAPAKRRIPKLARMGLIAACLCLALIGTAAAVHLCAPQLRNDGDGTVWLSGGIARHSYAALSDELKAMEGESFLKAFDSWQEVEDFIGFDLMNNPVLDASPALRESRYTLIIGDQSATGHYLIAASAGLDRIYTHSIYDVGQVHIRMRSTLYTDHIPEDLKEFYENWDETTAGFHYADGTEPVLENYTAPSGLTAQLLTVQNPAPEGTSLEDMPMEDVRYYCTATFSINGVPFEAHTTCRADKVDAALAALKQVLDGFVLSE